MEKGTLTPTPTPSLYPPVLFLSPQHSIGDTLSLSATKTFQTVSHSLDKGDKMEALDQILGELLKLLGIKLNLMTAYHPQTDGATEQINQEIEAYLSIYCSAHPTEWKNLLSTLEFTHND